MRVFFKFVVSLISLPFLIPWYLSEKLYQYVLQPVQVRKFQSGSVTRRKGSLWKRLLFVVLALALILVAKTSYQVVASEAAAPSVKVFFFMMYNDVAFLINLFLQPINNLLVFTQGGEIGFGSAMLSFYLLLLPLIIFANIGYCWISTRVVLNHARSLRDKADRQVNIVGYSQKAQNDEIFFGLDINDDLKPFYAKVKWLMGHVQVIGSPGSGKSESVIQPLWFQSVRRNVPTFVFDGKATSQNVDRYYTIASSLAQGHEVIYFNPLEPARSATYNPLLNGTNEEVKGRILASLNWSQYTAGSREKLEYYLSLILNAIKETGRPRTLYEIFKYLDYKKHVQNQVYRIADPNTKTGLLDMIHNYAQVQKEIAFFKSTLQELCLSEYGNLLETTEPALDFFDVYRKRKDCYMTLPIEHTATPMAFLGQLMMHDLLDTFYQLSVRSDNSAIPPHGNGLVVIDELVKFANMQFIDLLRFCRNLGVSVCYTNQTIGELERPEMNLHHSFIEQLADQTNMLFCFGLGDPDSIKAVAARMAPQRGGANASDAQLLDPATIRQLEVGRCIVFARTPYTLKVLKTGYFQFEKLLRYDRQESVAA